MTLVLVFLANAGLSFALSLVLAAILGPEGYGRYALGSALAALLGATLLEWLRLSTVRFYSDRARLEQPQIRASLDRGYRHAAIGTGLAAALALALGAVAPTVPGGLVAAAGLCGLAFGLCDYRLALARARFLEGAFVRIAGTRALAVSLGAASAALLTGDPAIVLGAAGLGALLPVLATRRRLTDPAATGGGLGGESGRATLLGFARYGLPLVAASALYQLMPLLNRTVLSEQAGFVAAGYFGLASELATRLFQNLGAALDLVLFQLVVRTEEEFGTVAADRQVSRNAGLIVAILLPAAAGWWVVWPSFEALFIPAAFQRQLEPTMMLMIPALAAFALAQCGLGAAFQLRRRTGPAIWAAVAAILTDIAMLLVAPGEPGPNRAAAAQLAGSVAGMVVLGWLAAASGQRLPWRDIGTSLLASSLMLAALWHSRGYAPSAFLLVLQVAAGVALYGGLALVLDIAGARRVVVEGRWFEPPAPCAGSEPAPIRR